MIRSLLFAPIAAMAICVAAPAAQVPLPGGTYIEDLEAGTGAEAHSGQTVTVHYTGWLFPGEERGKKFDSSRDGKPFSFALGAGEVIKGWDDGVVGMKVGGVRELIIPPEAGYGAEGSDPIPPNAWLIFEVELLAVE